MTNVYLANQSTSLTPTDSQKKSGNYRKGKFQWNGLTITIENPIHSYRTGIDKATGERWSQMVFASYGYINGTTGADGDQVDCFVGNHIDAEIVYVIDQYVDGQFDEHKVMIGYRTESEAADAYSASYEQGWQGLQKIKPLSVKQFKNWLRQGKKIMKWKDATPIGATFDSVLYDIRYHDVDDLLCERQTMATLGVPLLDSLVVQKGRLSAKFAAVKRIINGLGKELTVTDAETTEPYRAYGTTVIAVVLSLSDGQSITAFLHNPDSKPAKIAETDSLVAFKWALNRKDVTVFAAKEDGRDVEAKVIAQRILGLAIKNMKAFAKAQGRTAETQAKIEALGKEINELEAEYEDLAVKVEAKKAAGVSEPVTPVIDTHEPVADPQPEPDIIPDPVIQPDPIIEPQPEITQPEPVIEPEPEITPTPETIETPTPKPQEQLPSNVAHYKVDGHLIEVTENEDDGYLTYDVDSKIPGNAGLSTLGSLAAALHYIATDLLGGSFAKIDTNAILDFVSQKLTLDGGENLLGLKDAADIAQPEPEITPEPEPVIEPIAAPEPEIVPVTDPEPEPVIDPVVTPEPVIEHEPEAKEEPEPDYMDDIRYLESVKSGSFDSLRGNIDDPGLESLCKNTLKSAEAVPNDYDGLRFDAANEAMDYIKAAA